MAIPTSEQFLLAAEAEDGQPVSAGGPPLRELRGVCQGPAREGRDHHNLQATDLSEVEQQRQEAVDDMVAEHGPNWAKEYVPGSFGCHELLDRTNLAAEAVERTVLDHPACARNPDWYALAHQAVTALNELYQRVGAEHLAADNHVSSE